MQAPPASEQSLLEERIRQHIRRELPRAGPGSAPAAAAEDSVPAELLPLLDEDFERTLGEDVDRIAEGHALWPALVAPARPPVRMVRRILGRLLRPVLAAQSDLNATLARSTARLRDRSADLRDLTVDHALRLAVLERAVAELTELRPTTRRLEQTVRFLERELAHLREAPSPRSLDYLELTDRFRGSEEAIRKRQHRHLRRFKAAGDVLDIGCGRGEFLELLRHAGIRSSGVDTDVRMVELCREKSLDVVEADALTYLERLPAAALGGIFAAHVIEHMRSEDVIALVHAAARVLRPGSALVIETPNPECLAALASFAIDFTHVRPYHPEAMRWLLEQEGFENVEVEYASAVELPAGTEPRAELAADPLRSLLFGYQEYAVVGGTPAAA